MNAFETHFLMCFFWISAPEDYRCHCEIAEAIGFCDIKRGSMAIFAQKRKCGN